MGVMYEDVDVEQIRQAIARGDASMRGGCTVFVHMRARAAQSAASFLSQGNYEPEGFGAVFVLPEEIVGQLIE